MRRDFTTEMALHHRVEGRNTTVPFTVMKVLTAVPTLPNTSTPQPSRSQSVNSSWLWPAEEPL